MAMVQDPIVEAQGTYHGALITSIKENPHPLNQEACLGLAALDNGCRSHGARASAKSKQELQANHTHKCHGGYPKAKQKQGLAP